MAKPTLFPVDNEVEFANAKKHAADFFIQFLGGLDILSNLVVLPKW